MRPRARGAPPRRAGGRGRSRHRRQPGHDRAGRAAGRRWPLRPPSMSATPAISPSRTASSICAGPSVSSAMRRAPDRDRGDDPPGPAWRFRAAFDFDSDTTVVTHPVRRSRARSPACRMPPCPALDRPPALRLVPAGWHCRTCACPLRRGRVVYQQLNRERSTGPQASGPERPLMRWPTGGQG